MFRDDLHNYELDFWNSMNRKTRDVFKNFQLIGKWCIIFSLGSIER
jgi:hypothetical protein